MGTEPTEPSRASGSPSEGAVPELTDEELALLESAFGLAREGRTGELRALIDAGLPVNLTNAKGDTLLILAAYHRHAATVASLLEAGADPDRVNDMGQTALSAAVFRQDEEIVRSLLAGGGDPDAGGLSARAVAEQFGLEAMARLLAEG